MNTTKMTAASVATEVAVKEVREKDPIAVALGRRGGLVGGHARAQKLGKSKLSELAAKASKARWDKFYLEHPETPGSDDTKKKAKCEGCKRMKNIFARGRCSRCYARDRRERAAAV